MDRNTTLAFVLIGLILIIWLWINSPTPKQTPPKKSDSTLVKKDTVSIQKEKEVQKEKTAKVDTLGKYFANVKSGRNQIVTIENELFKAEINSTGAKIQKLFLKKYTEWYGGNVQLINSSKGGDLTVTFLTNDGKSINTGYFEFSPEKDRYNYNLKDNDSLSVSFVLKLSDSSYIKKTFTAHKNKYGLRVDIEFLGMEKIIYNYKYDLNWENGIRFVEKDSHDEALFSNASFYSAEELFTIDATSLNEKVVKDINGVVDWVATRNKYFQVAIIPVEKDPDGGALIEGKAFPRPEHGTYEQYNLTLKRSFKNTHYQKNTYLVYLGPIEYDILKEYYPTLESVVDFGSFFGLKFLVRPIAEYILLPLLKFLHSFISNYGLVIIIFSLIIKIALHPLTRQSMRSMKKMQLLQPKMTELKEKFKDNPQKMNQEVMKLYKTYGINPAGGCLPLLLQMPILIALYGLFRATIDLRHESFMLWIKDLSTPDVIATLPFRLPLFGINQISGLALLLGITMFLQQKMSVTDPRQKAMIYIMPIMFTLLFAGFPSGLNLYYFMFNIFSIAQQWWMNKYSKQIELVPVKQSSKKGFMQRLLEQAETNAKERRKQMMKR